MTEIGARDDDGFTLEQKTEILLRLEKQWLLDACREHIDNYLDRDKPSWERGQELSEEQEESRSQLAGQFVEYILKIKSGKSVDDAFGEANSWIKEHFRRKRENPETGFER